MRLIDADELIAKIDETVKISMFHIKGETLKGAALLVFENFQALVNAVPIIDAEPVRHGRWLERYSPGGVRLCECSVCGTSAISQDDTWGYVIDYYETDFCPNCGAKMDGGEGV